MIDGSTALAGFLVGGIIGVGILTAVALWRSR